MIKIHNNVILITPIGIKTEVGSHVYYIQSTYNYNQPQRSITTLGCMITHTIEM